MKCTLRTKLLLRKTDFFCVLSERSTEIVLYSLLSLLGIAFGVYVGIKVGIREEPFGVFARLFRFDYEPFSYILPETLRFLLFSLIASLSYFLPIYPIYPSFSIFFFAKHFGEYACLVFLTDLLHGSLLSICVIILPILLLGSALLIRIALYAKDFRLCDGGFPCIGSIKRAGCILLCSLLLYLGLLILLHFFLCGILYLLIYAL